MNNITKLGVSALCGSLAAVSAANAGEMTVTGGADMSWTSFDGPTTGNPIGIGSNLTFNGSGELDNGWGVALSTALTNANATSNTNVVITIPSLGAIRIDQGLSGTGIDRIDDVTPNVWEEAYGTGLSTGIDTVAGASGGSGIEFTPSIGLPEGLTAVLHWTPDADGSNANDKGSSGVNTGAMGAGYDVTLTATDAVHGMTGLTVYGGMSSINQDDTVANYSGDKDEWTVAANYAMGNFTIGYQISEEDLGKSAGAQKYENEGFGITFAVNDDLSIGYNFYESEQTNTTNQTAEASSIQVAYSMGGASVRLASAEIDNANYSTNVGKDQKATTLSVALAF
jgi:outer membrane protein OmpU